MAQTNTKKQRKPRKAETRQRDYFVERVKPFRGYDRYLDPERGLTKEYYWSACNNMTSRCYNEHFHEIRPEYIGCQMCPEWRESRENIVQWIYENMYVIPGETMSIDKDLKIPGNKIYSPETCIILPVPINTFFTPERNKKERDLPPGVYQQKASDRFFTLWRKEDGSKEYHAYVAAEEAREAYLSHKEEQRDQMLEIYQEKGLPTDILELIREYDIRSNF